MDLEITKTEFLAYLKVYKLWKGNKQQKRRILRRLAEKLIGNKCKICNSTQNLVFHEKYGKKHPLSYWEARYYYYIENHGDFVSLCGECHRFVHGYALIDITKDGFLNGAIKYLENKKEPQIAFHLIRLLTSKNQ